MNTHDIDQFDSAMADVFELYGRALSERQVEMWFRLLKEHPLRVIQEALDAHIKDQARGRYCPMPADVLAQIGRATDWTKGAV